MTSVRSIIEAGPLFPAFTQYSHINLCRHQFCNQTWAVNPGGLEEYVAVRNDWTDLELFWSRLPMCTFLPERFNVISVSSYYTAIERFKHYADNPRLIHWYLKNATIEHPKITAIPIGLMIRNTDQQNIDKFKTELKAAVPKDTLVCAGFSVATNPGEREKCLKYSGVHNPPFMARSDYYRMVHRSMFVLSPSGVGPDCHRTWEALYFGAIPVTTATFLRRKWGHLPILFIDSWEDYPKLGISEALYRKLWRDCSADLRFDAMLRHVGILGD